MQTCGPLKVEEEGKKKLKWSKVRMTSPGAGVSEDGGKGTPDKECW